MSLTEMIAKLDSLTPEERVELARAALAKAQVASLPEASEVATPAEPERWQPKLSEEEFVRQMVELGPMLDETYAAYQQAIAWSSEIDHNEWE